MRWEGRRHRHGKELSVPEEVPVDVFYVFQIKFGWQTWPEGMVCTEHIHYELGRNASHVIIL